MNDDKSSNHNWEDHSVVEEFDTRSHNSTLHQNPNGLQNSPSQHSKSLYKTRTGSPQGLPTLTPIRTPVLYPYNQQTMPKGLAPIRSWPVESPITENGAPTIIVPISLIQGNPKLVRVDPPPPDQVVGNQALLLTHKVAQPTNLPLHTPQPKEQLPTIAPTVTATKNSNILAKSHQNFKYSGRKPSLPAKKVIGH